MVNQPVLLLRASSDPTAALCAEVLRCEGFPWLSEQPAAAFDGAPPEVRVIVVAGVGVGSDVARRLARAVTSGVTLIATAPEPAIAAALGVTVGAPILDAHLSVSELPHWEHGGQPLLCPDDTARPLTGGRERASLRDTSARRAGAGLVEVALGAGRAWLYGYDLCRTIITLRHGTGSYDERPQRDMGPLYGPRQVYSFFKLSNQLPRNVPVSDLHQDILPTLMRESLATSMLPRLWHFPNQARALWMLKGDGCGEAGADLEIDLAERHGAVLTFYAPPKSRFGAELMREWHVRGHAISIEPDITGITQYTEQVDGQTVRRGRAVAEVNQEWFGTLRACVQGHRDSFVDATGIEAETVCIHGCQWTGRPMAELIVELGWHTPTHFTSHDPRMRRHDRYGPYMISSGLPLPYYEPGEGLLDMWYQPAHWNDAGTLGRHDALLAGPLATQPWRVSAIVGLTAEEYGLEISRFAQDAAARWHGAQIATFHPCYLVEPDDSPRKSLRALELALPGVRAAGCRFISIEEWSHFFRARAAVRLADWRSVGDGVQITLSSADDVAGLTLLIPPGVSSVRLAQTGATLPVTDLLLEARMQRAVDVDLEAGKPLTLHLSTNGQ